ncbi:MAG: penicillin-binding transpeptidase domain-containing protein [Acidimicrobiales bacterium]
MAGAGTRAGTTALVAVLGVAGIVVALRQGGDGPGPESTAEDYVAAWQDGDMDVMADLVIDPPNDFAEIHQAVLDDLGTSEATYELGDVSTDEDNSLAIAHFDATLAFADLGEWSYEGTFNLLQEGDGDNPWRVDWSPASIHPRLARGLTLTSTRVQPERAPITDAAGEPLVAAGPGMRIGIEPQRMQDRQQVSDALSTHLGVDPATVDARLDAPGVEPDHFVEIVTVPRARYDEVRAAIFDVPGLLFRETTVRTAPSDGFARHVLGSTGEITAEQLDELGEPYGVGDIVGRTGLEARFERELAGTPSGEIQLLDPTGAVVEVIDQIEGTAPTPVATTLDPQVQAAVESGLAGVTLPAAVVVVDAAGNVRAAASRPLDEFNRALAGLYPPGSTMKIVTTSGLLDSGITAETPVDCPETLNAGGRVFRNFEGGSLGVVPFGTAFAESCNTAFINVTADRDPADMVAAAEQFGFNTTYSVGLDTESASFPEPADATEKAAAAIGQAEVVASPLHMATVAATVIDGTWEPPTLLPEVDTGDRPEPTQLEATSRETLAALMRRVVTEGSGSAAAVDNCEVAGKTGTAEFGSGDPLPTHAWFVGICGDLALAIVIEDGGVGGRDAAPIAGAIFDALPAP